MIRAEAATYNPPRSVGPLTLGMSIPEFAEATGQTIVECSESPADNFSWLARTKSFSACGFNERYGAINGGNAISTQTSVGARSVTVIMGASKNMNERMKKLTNSEWEHIMSIFVDGELARIVIPLPAVTLEFLEEKYGSSYLTDETQIRQCFNRDGFADNSNFGITWNSWFGPTETLHVKKEKVYDNESKQCYGWGGWKDPNILELYTLEDSLLVLTLDAIIKSAKTDEQPKGASEF
jgi:hypothetical protein